MVIYCIIVEQTKEKNAVENMVEPKLWTDFSNYEASSVTKWKSLVTQLAAVRYS